MSKAYEAPKVTLLGTLEELTASLDKIGSASDALTSLMPALDGDFTPDQ